jgi:hypothetical protein
VIELARGAGSACQGFDIDGDRDMRTLTRHRLTIGQVEPLPADLPEGVHPSLSRRAGVFPIARPGVGVLDRTQCCNERLSGFRIQIAVHPDHPVQ